MEVYNEEEGLNIWAIITVIAIIIAIAATTNNCKGQNISFIAENPIEVVDENLEEPEVIFFGTSDDAIFRVGTEITLTIATKTNRYYMIGNKCTPKLDVICVDMGYYLLWIIDGKEYYLKPGETILL